jgi:hypothetical protein
MHLVRSTGLVLFLRNAVLLTSVTAEPYRQSRGE